MKKPTLYLAGPDVFERRPDRTFETLLALCEQFGFEGLVPGDGGLAAGSEASGDLLAQRIYEANIDLIRRCDGVLANLAPFRNALEPDSGTVFEVGFAVALGKPVAGYNVCGRFEDRIAQACGREWVDGKPFDRTHGYLIESMGQGLNLMLSRSAGLHETVPQALTQLARKLLMPQAA